MRILVTGGTGYIGSHTAVQLVRAGHDVAIADNFSGSKPTVAERIAAITGAPVDVRQVNLTDLAQARELFRGENFDAVMHFAGLKAVGESIEQPLRYYSNNIGSTLSVLFAMKESGVRRLVFSSTATVYGANPPLPMHEDLPTAATNPYGWSKVMQEQVLHDFARAEPTLRVAVLRYFNPVGAHPSGLLGEDPRGVPNNLMPLISQIAVGRRGSLKIYGRDYPTPDGTARRDYLHVEDLAAGHVAALETLEVTDEGVSTWNLGTGHPTSVLEVVSAFERASGAAIPTTDAARRPGDIAESYADPSKAQRDLGWRATRTLDEMCADTWRWQSKNPDGYPPS